MRTWDFYQMELSDLTGYSTILTYHHVTLMSTQYKTHGSCYVEHQTWECVDVNNGVSSSHVFNDDVDAKQVKTERLLKSDCETAQLLSVWLKHG